MTFCDCAKYDNLVILPAIILCVYILLINDCSFVGLKKILNELHRETRDIPVNPVTGWMQTKQIHRKSDHHYN